MRRRDLRRCAVATTGLLALAASAGAAPAQERDALLAAARAVVERARFGTLVTLDASGAPRARAMDPFPPEPDFTVWLGTNARTRKVGEIRADPRVVLHWLDRDGPGYVTLRGEAELVDDPAEKRRRFKPEWQAFYRDGPRGEDYLLIRVRPRVLEVMSIPDGVASDPMGWAPAIIDLTPPEP